ncbi:MAG: hypothetical protein REI78_11605 [Pedobacter sp.]|nr:hypothetical protein [Pedobacter sp.]
MKLIAPLLFLVMSCLSLKAQESDSTTTRVNNLPNGLVEKSTRLKSNRNIRNGFAEISTADNGEIVAQGHYQADQRTGTWKFFKYGRLEQVYDYSQKKVIAVAADPSLTAMFDGNSSNQAHPAVRIGGTAYGFAAYLNYLTHMTKFVEGNYTIYFNMDIDNAGKLTKLSAKIVSAKMDKTIDLNIHKLESEDLEFIPAEFNGVRLNSHLVYKMPYKFWYK